MSKLAIRGLILAVTVAFMIGCLFSGCGELENKGDPPPNSPPQVFITNIPIDSAAFQSNPEVFWYATDRDGYITEYRYSVVRMSDLPTDGTGAPCPSCYADEARASNYEGWTLIRVADELVSTSGEIRLFAHENPDSLVAQCFFIEATDNFGSRSEIVYRTFQRSNHAPETEVSVSYGPHFAGTCPFVSGEQYASGISVQWSGSDYGDFPGRQPDFEYYWAVYGPFNNIEDTISISNWDPFMVDHSWSNDSTDVWTLATSTSLFNLFRNLESVDSTLTGLFVFKVQTRDDAFVPDSTPAVGVFMAIQPACERGIMLVDNTFWSVQTPGQLNGGCDPCWDFGGELTTERYWPYFDSLITEAGYELDTLYTVKKGNPDFDFPPPRDLICRYKLVIMLQEDYTYTPEQMYPWMARLAEFMDIGGKVMVIGRSAFTNTTSGNPTMIYLSSGSIGTRYFQIEGQYCANWLESWLNYRLTHKVVVSNEEFIGAGSLVSDLPDLRISEAHLQEYDGYTGFDAVLKEFFNHRYWQEFYVDVPYSPYPYVGVPGVNFYESSGISEGLYLAYSAYGQYGDIDGGVCGYRYETENFKSAVFGFPLYSIEPEDAIGLLRGMIEWFDIE